MNASNDYQTLLLYQFCVIGGGITSAKAYANAKGPIEIFAPESIIVL